jgi:hypothetical protein
MPNWCTNRVHISGSAEDVAAFKTLVRGSSSYENTFSFQSILPCPQDLLDVTDDAPSDYKDQLFLDYGYCNCYDWQVNNWGTKWDASDCYLDYEEEESACWQFETVRIPPEGIYEELSNRFPNLSISWFYDEPSMQISGYLNNPNNGV